MDTQHQKMTLKQKIENYWYHYKLHTILGAFILFVIIWGTVSAIGRTGDDISIGYIGEHMYTQEEAEGVCAKLSAFLDMDLDGNGKCDITLVQYQHYTDEQIAQLAAEAEEKGREFAYYPDLNKQNYRSFENDLATGNTAVWMVSKEVYEKMDKSVLLPISEVLGYLPDKGVADEYAIDCITLPLCCKATTALSANSYLVIRGEREYSFIPDDKEMTKQFENAKKLYKAIVEYKSN